MQERGGGFKPPCPNSSIFAERCGEVPGMDLAAWRLETAATMRCKVAPESTLSAARVLVLQGVCHAPEDALKGWTTNKDQSHFIFLKMQSWMMAMMAMTASTSI